MTIADPLGAFTRHSHVSLAGAAAGPLEGRTMAVKDVFDIAGHVTGNGNPDWHRTHPAATATASAVTRLLAAGAAMVGRTHTDELAYSLNGENVHYGTPRNPAAPGRIPGGSSSGSVSAVAGGLVDFAIGTDCGGSVRLPASYCGVYGLRPTHGRIAADGIVALAASFDTVGWFARSPDLLDMVAEVLLAEEGAAALPSRVLVVEDAFALAGEAVSEALRPGLDRVTGTVGPTARISLGHERMAGWMEDFRILQGAEIWANHGAWVSATRPSFGPGIRERFAFAATITDEQVARCKAHRLALAQELAGLLEGGAVLCLPTAPGIAPLLNTPPAELDSFRSRALSLLCLAGLAGLPQINLPLGQLDGAPIGLSLIGARDADRALTGVARALDLRP